jgi:transcription antitermination factor NusG
MNSDTKSESWFAIQVRTRWERSAATLVAAKGYEVFLPIYQSKRHWSDRVREVSAPLFPGYLFCRFDVQKRLPILVTPGVIGVVGRGRIPVPVEESEILSIKQIVSSGVTAEPWPYLEVGQRVRIENHALRGLEGILIGHRGNQRVVVSVSLLQRSVALEIERSRLSLIHPVEERFAGPGTEPLWNGGIA